MKKREEKPKTLVAVRIKRANVQVLREFLTFLIFLIVFFGIALIVYLLDPNQ